MCVSGSAWLWPPCRLAYNHQTHTTTTIQQKQVIPPKGWYPEQPKTQEEVEALFTKLRLMVPPIKQFVSGARGAYQLALVR